jgi:curved DNA-binding protein CbpA
MDKAFLFYVKLLGLKEQFTQNELKAAYRQSAEKYHPDKYANAPAHEKQHALDIMQQINEAYDYLKNYNVENRAAPNINSNQFKNQNVTKNVHSVEDTYYAYDNTYEIFLPETGDLLKYSLSKDIKGIEKAIKKRTLQIWNGNRQTWGLNQNLSESVKKLMNKYNVDYSMTTYLEGVYRVTVINRRRGNQWYICLGEELDGLGERIANNREDRWTVIKYLLVTIITIGFLVYIISLGLP